MVSSPCYIWLRGYLESPRLGNLSQRHTVSSASCSMTSWQLPCWLLPQLHWYFRHCHFGEVQPPCHRLRNRSVPVRAQLSFAFQSCPTRCPVILHDILGPPSQMGPNTFLEPDLVLPGAGMAPIDTPDHYISTHFYNARAAPRLLIHKFFQRSGFLYCKPMKAVCAQKRVAQQLDL